VGGESIAVAAPTMMSKWFGEGDHLNTFMACNVAIVHLSYIFLHATSFFCLGSVVL
jgi:hypothetical protein